MCEQAIEGAIEVDRRGDRILDPMSDHRRSKTDRRRLKVCHNALSMCLTLRDFGPLSFVMIFPAL